MRSYWIARVRDAHGKPLVVPGRRMPRPIGVSSLDFPRWLRRKKVSGEIVLLLDLNREGQVLDAQVDSSGLPDFDDFVLSEVKTWSFTPPTRWGHPVRAEARLPIPIEIH